MKILLSQRFFALLNEKAKRLEEPFSAEEVSNTAQNRIILTGFTNDFDRTFSITSPQGKERGHELLKDIKQPNLSFYRNLFKSRWPDISEKLIDALIYFGHQSSELSGSPIKPIYSIINTAEYILGLFFFTSWQISPNKKSDEIKTEIIVDAINKELSYKQISTWYKFFNVADNGYADDKTNIPVSANGAMPISCICTHRIATNNNNQVTLRLENLEIAFDQLTWQWLFNEKVSRIDLDNLSNKVEIFSVTPFLLEGIFRKRYCETISYLNSAEKIKDFIMVASCFLDDETYPKESALFFRELASKIAKLKKAKRALFISSSLSTLKNSPIEKSKLLQALIKNKTCFRSLENHLNSKQGQDKSNFAAEVFSALISYPAEQKKWLKLFTKESQLKLIESTLNTVKDKPEEKANLLASFINNKAIYKVLLNYYKTTSDKNAFIYDTIIALKNHPKELKIWVLRFLNNEARRQDLIKSGVLDHLFTIPTPTFLEGSQIIQSSLILRDLIASNPKKIFSGLYKNSSIKGYLQQKAILALRKQEAADRYGKEWVDAANILLDIYPKINTRKSRYQITSEDNAHAIDFNIEDQSAILLLRRFLKKNLLHRLVPRFGLWERAWGLWKLSVNTADEAFNLMITHPYHLEVSGWFFNRRILGFVKSWAERMSSKQLLDLFIFAPITRKRLSNNENLAIEALKLYEAKQLQGENLVTLFNHSKIFRQLLKQKDKDKLNALAFIYRFNKKILKNTEELTKIISTIADIGSETFAFISSANPFFRQLLEHYSIAQAKRDAININSDDLQKSIKELLSLDRDTLIDLFYAKNPDDFSKFFKDNIFFQQLIELNFSLQAKRDSLSEKDLANSIKQLLSLDSNTFSTLFRTNKYVNILLTQYLDSIKDVENDPLKEIIQNRLIGYFYELLQTTNNNQEVKDEKLIARHLATLYLLYPLQRNIFFENQGLLADLSKLEDKALIKELLKDENLTTSKLPEIQMFVKRLTETHQKLEKAQPQSNNEVANAELIVDKTQLTKHSTAIAAIMPLAKKLNLFDKNAKPLSKSLAEYSPKPSIRNTHR